MADLGVVALGIDSTGVTSGQQQVTRSLQSIEAEMQKAEQQANQLSKGLGGAFQKTSKSANEFSTSVTKSTQALSGLGGPIGKLGGQIGSISGQLDSLVGSFGSLGGAAVGAVAGVVALGAGLVKLTLDGVKLSDELGDIGQAMGFTQEQMERLNAATRISGESIGFVERSFGQFENAIKQGLEDPASDAAKALVQLGVNAKRAATDPQAAFLSLLSTLGDVTKSFESQQAAHTIFTRSTAVMIRVAEEYKNQLQFTEDQLISLGFATSSTSQQMASDIDKNINTVILQFDNLKRALVSEVGPALLEFFKAQINAIREFSAVAQGFKSGGIIGAVGAGIQFERQQAITDKQIETRRKFGGLFGVGVSEPGGFDSRLTPAEKLKTKATTTGSGVSAAEREAEKRARELAAAVKREEDENAKQRKSAADKLITDMDKLSDEMNALTAATAAAAKAAKEPPVIKETTADIFHRLGIPIFAGAAAPPIAAGGRIPGANLPNPADGDPSKILGVREQRIQQSFANIFDGFITTLITARATIGEAFKNFALDIVDSFAQEFSASLTKSLFSSKGISKFFSGAAKFFAGLFADGGTINPGQFGIVGERGPELAFAGSRPLQIAPITGGGGGGNSYNINIGINAPSGTVDRRTQDQLAATLLSAIRRGQRNEGAR